MRSLGLSAISIILTSAVIGNAYYQKKQFYPSVVYITKSNPSMAVIYVQFFVIVLMMGKLLRKIFLGSLRPAEFEHLIERFWYALTETCLAFTVFRDDFNPRFVALFTVLLFLKSFHWLAEERIDYMERSPIIGWIFHIRASSLLAVLSYFDYLMIIHAYNSTVIKGASVQLVFGFEYAILITVVANTAIKYALHAAEMRADSPWENKAVFLLYTELIIGFIRVVLYILFVIIMARIYALPMFVFRPMFYTIRNFKKALNDMIMSRRAIRNMNTLYPDATPEELASSDNICIICREDMMSSSKKLPCGHIFHTACLRSWFQRQQTCPTCRLNILRTPTTNAGPRQETQNVRNISTQIPNLNLSNNNNNNNPGGNPFVNLFAQNIPNSGAQMNNNPNQLPFFLPPFPMMAPFTIPPPPMPAGLNHLTDEELKALEGTERRNVEERIKLLRNIQLLLDASVNLMNQYTLVVSRLPDISQTSDSNVQTDPLRKNNVPLEKNCSANNISDASNETNSSNQQTKIKTDEILIEDIGSAENIDLVENKPSTSSTITENDEISEIRKRRLQKFLPNESVKTE